MTLSNSLLNTPTERSVATVPQIGMWVWSDTVGVVRHSDMCGNVGVVTSSTPPHL